MLEALATTSPTVNCSVCGGLMCANRQRAHTACLTPGVRDVPPAPVGRLVALAGVEQAQAWAAGVATWAHDRERAALEQWAAALAAVEVEASAPPPAPAPVPTPTWPTPVVVGDGFTITDLADFPDPSPMTSTLDGGKAWTDWGAALVAAFAGSTVVAAAPPSLPHTPHRALGVGDGTAGGAQTLTEPSNSQRNTLM